MGVYVFQHEDADGISSGAIVRRYYRKQGITPTNVCPPFIFGVDQSLLELPKDGDDVYILDLGTDHVLDEVSKVCARFHSVTIIDHHSIRAETLDVPKNVTIVHDYDLPASMQTYLYLMQTFGDDDVCQKLAIVGTFGDMAEGNPVADALLNRYRENQKWLFERPEERTTGFLRAVRISALFNAARRIYYHEGAEFVLHTLDDVGEDWTLLDPTFFGSLREPSNPKVALIHHWKDMWNRYIHRLEKQIVWLDSETEYSFALGFVDHRWSVCGFFASKGAEERKKPAILVNVGFPPFIKMSARKPSFAADDWMAKVDFDLFWGIVEKTSNGLMSGGGHRDAAGGSAPKGTDIEVIMDVLGKSWGTLMGGLNG